MARPQNRWPSTQRCTTAEYRQVANILQLSAVPVLLVPGDNEWNDCPNPNQAWNIWLNVFEAFEGKHWKNDTRFGTLVRMPDRPETFSFIHQGALFVGLNLVGGQVLNEGEWSTRLTDQVEWVKDLMRQHGNTPTVGFGHANPVNNHDDFFVPLRDFVQDELQNSVPLMYINGDKHR